MRIALLFFVAFSSLGLARAAEIAHDDFKSGLVNWVIEQMPGGTVTLRDGAMVIDDAAGCTVWFRQKLVAPVTISYEVTVISKGGANDRVSDLNCFWMASDRPDGKEPVAPYLRQPGRTGKFSDYDSLLTYYVGYGGNTNTTTRFRRYDGTVARPLLPEHDLRAPSVLLQANRTYQIKLVARDGFAEFWRDGDRIFNFRDPVPLNSGWLGFRTVQSHLAIRNFRVTSP